MKICRKASDTPDLGRFSAGNNLSHRVYRDIFHRTLCFNCLNFLISDGHIIIHTVSEVQLRNIRRTRHVWNLSGKAQQEKRRNESLPC